MPAWAQPGLTGCGVIDSARHGEGCRHRERQYVTATAYCAAKGISPPTLYRMLKRGRGPETVRVSKNCRLFRLRAYADAGQGRIARGDRVCRSDTERSTRHPKSASNDSQVLDAPPQQPFNE
jgi:hypothetical protein